MDAIILAAGRGERLSDIIPPYYKPVMAIDGKPLIRLAVERAITHPSVERATVVASPENARVISKALKGLPYLMIVQPDPLGPLDAFYTGYQVGKSERVLLMMSDNVSSESDLKAVVDKSDMSGVSPAIGVKRLTREEATRFTVYNWHSQAWDEKVEITSAHTENDHVTAWCGPVVMFRNDVDSFFAKHTWLSDEENLIGPWLDLLAPRALHASVSTYDIGIPSFWKRDTDES